MKIFVFQDTFWAFSLHLILNFCLTKMKIKTILILDKRKKILAKSL